jgi:D-citramalate synthase
LGERAGNAPLASIAAVLKDHTEVTTGVNEEKLTLLSKMVETFSGIRIPANKPVVGENVFTQASGVHADGDNKDRLYYNDLLPERFGRVRKYALGKTSGKSNILKNLEELGIRLEPEAMQRVTNRIIELSDRKENVTSEDLPYIISDVLQSDGSEHHIRVHNYSLNVAEGLKSVATLSLEVEGVIYQETSAGDGQYDAFMNALRKIYVPLNRELPRLTDYVVTIPPGGRTDALVETVIRWQTTDKHEFTTRGLDPDQTISAIQATVKMLNIIR